MFKGWLWKRVEKVFDEEDAKAREEFLTTSDALRRILKATLREICDAVEKC